MRASTSSGVFKTTSSPFAKEFIETIAAVHAIEKRIRGKSAELRTYVTVRICRASSVANLAADQGHSLRARPLERGNPRSR